MKLSLKLITGFLIFISFIYTIYVSFLFFNNLFVGTELKYNSSNQLVVTEVMKDSPADYLGLKKGDIIYRINDNKISKENRVDEKEGLYRTYSLIVLRGNEYIDILTKDYFIAYDILFVYLIPLIFYLLCLVCIFIILKANKSKRSLSSFLLIVFLLDISIAYLSGGGAYRRDLLSRYVNILTFISVPICYLHFISQYFKEIGNRIISNKVFVLYILPVANIVLELFYRSTHIFEYDISLTALINLFSFLIGIVITVVFVIFRLIRYKHSEQTYYLKMLLLTNYLAILPFLIFYVIPLFIIGDYIYSAPLVTPSLLLIPFSLVYQFMSNKMYNIEFLIGRLKYYGILAIIPTIIVISTITLMKYQAGDYYTLRLAIYIYLIMLGVFYFKEILDFRFRLKRFSEKFNYQDSIFKFTQMIRACTSLNQVLMELKQTILDVLIVSQAYVLEVDIDGNVVLVEGDTHEDPWIPYQKEVTKVTSSIGKIIEVDRGFLIKIGERGGTSYVMLCLSVLNTPKLTRDEISWLETLAFYTSVSLENVLKIGELLEHLENVKEEGTNPAWLNKLMFGIEEKQRSDLARDLHDSVLQDMISLKHKSEIFLAELQKDQVCIKQIQQKLTSFNKQMSNVIQTTRETCQELRPQVLYDLGLVKALSKLASQHRESTSLRIRLNTERFSTVLDLDTQLNLYRIVQEFLSNTVKHAKASEVLIMLVCIKEKVILHYEDDGIGFDQDKLYQNNTNMGLSGIRERVRALDGHLDIKTAIGRGFKADIEMEL
ncbi:PDZ domain-containing protein [Bacillus sp. WMMC1349]|uniref:histidine kinase n=1 Tax=Bacillus sp. WMMC1349 TaxID=2736254 RepID=UPI0015531020|nr:histidine kinase [Bacillus sp. WMMC1349]NPC93978.1 PDZ domain-containing protein [Bacillus sp. WMMC1349]